MNRGHGCNIPGAEFFQGQWRLVAQPLASVAEKWSLTNRIRSQFARIKAAKTASLPIVVTAEIGTATKVRIFRQRKSGHFEDESQDTSGP
jgi:hypothetical protein